MTDTDARDDLYTAAQVELVEKWVARLARPGGASFSELQVGGKPIPGRYAELGEVDLILPKALSEPGQARECYVKMGDSDNLCFLDGAELHVVKVAELIIGPVSLSKVQGLILQCLLTAH